MHCSLCGIGSIGQRHYKNLRALGHEVAIFRSGKSTEYNTAFLEKFFTGQAKSKPVQEFNDFNDALAQFKHDSVFVTNPNAEHLSLSLQAARAGKHLFIEKPVATTLDGIDELQELVTRKKLVAMVGYNLRLHPLLKKMKEPLDGGD